MRRRLYGVVRGHFGLDANARAVRRDPRRPGIFREASNFLSGQETTTPFAKLFKRSVFFGRSFGDARSRHWVVAPHAGTGHTAIRRLLIEKCKSKRPSPGECRPSPTLRPMKLLSPRRIR